MINFSCGICIHFPNSHFSLRKLQQNSVQKIFGGKESHDDDGSDEEMDIKRFFVELH